MAQVKGTVLYKDGSAPKGGVCAINFSPTDGSTAEVRKSATGKIGPDGSFEMWTKMPGDGVHLGEYAVSFAVWPGPMDPRSLIEPKYTGPKTSGYTVNVTDDVDDLKFEIEPLPGAAGRPGAGAAAAGAPAKPAG